MQEQLDLKPFLDLATRMAEASGEVIRRYFRRRFEVKGKADASPVTIADQETERTLRGFLAKERPEDGLWGEEYGSAHMEAPFFWVLDPIDGTRAFATGKPLFGTLIALLHEGTPVLGVIDQPILKERWIGADGLGTTFNGEPCSTRRCSGIENAVSILSPHFPDDDEKEIAPFRKLAPRVRTTSSGGDCYSYAMVASGFADLVLENHLKLHDFAALDPVIRGAGGTMCDWRGQRLSASSKGDVLAAGDARVAHAILDLLKEPA